MSSPRFPIACFGIATLFSLTASLPAFADSQVRIVRLSYIEGGVQVGHDAAQGYEKAMVNLPITQGTKLKTADDGRAEVEFEDGSTIRITPNSIVEFPQLSLRDSGAKASEVEITKGTAYLDFAGTKNDEFAIEFEHEKVMLAQAARLRVNLADKNAAVAVFKGDIRVDGPSGAVEVKKNQTVNFDLSDNDRYKLAKDIQREPYDSWDKQQADYHVRYASKSYGNYSPYAYGTSDLAYYGNFFDAPGYGMMWQPYFAGPGWDPFMNGAWAFNPGWGFGWVSAYPWGWTPYHYGTWVFVPAYGWAWQPGGVWTSWYSQPRLQNPPKGFLVPQAPRTGATTLIVNRGPASMVANQSGSKLMIRNNSAGLGVPRGQINNLAKVSHQAQERGTVTERMHPAPVAQYPAPAAGQMGSSRPSQPMPSRMSAPSAPSSRPSSTPSPGGPAHR